MNKKAHEKYKDHETNGCIFSPRDFNQFINHQKPTTLNYNTTPEATQRPPNARTGSHLGRYQANILASVFCRWLNLLGSLPNILGKVGGSEMRFGVVDVHALDSGENTVYFFWHLTCLL